MPDLLWPPDDLLAFAERAIRDHDRLRRVIACDWAAAELPPESFVARLLAENRVGLCADNALALGQPSSGRYLAALHACGPVAASIVAILRGGDRELARRLIARECGVAAEPSPATKAA